LIIYLEGIEYKNAKAQNIIPFGFKTNYATILLAFFPKIKQTLVNCS